MRYHVRCGVLLAGLGWVAAGGGCSRPAAAISTLTIPRVTVAQPESRELADYDEYNGWLQAAERVEVRSRVRGYIQAIHFQDGDLVTQGQPLFTLDPRPFQVSIDETLAEAKALEAQQLAAAKAAERNRELVKSGAVSRQELEQSEADAASYTARIQAALQQAEKYKLDLEYSRITAPIAGRISRAQLTVGNLVNAGGSDPLLTTIVSRDSIHVYFDVDERALQRYQALARTSDSPTPATIREARIPFYFGRETDDGYPHEGVLDFAENQVDAATGTIQVRGVASNAEGLFVPGSRVRVRMALTKPRPILVIPDTAVLSEQDRKYVLLVSDAGIVLRRDLTLGRLLDDGQRVVTGEVLQPSDWVIVLGLQRARVNYPVEAVDASGQTVVKGSPNVAAVAPPQE